MGITGLLQMVESCTEPSTVYTLQGRTVAVDSYWLLHKGSYSCSDKLVRGIKTTKMLDYVMKYVKLLLSTCSNVIMVFDGRSLPAKKETELKRRENREKAKLKAEELAKNGRHDEAKKEFDKAVVITHEHALELMEECRRYNVDCIVAMYEADSQLAYLNKIGLAEYIISEDSDLILFGCKKIVYKLTLDGKCVLFESDKLHNLFPKYSFEKFKRICILSGCDYVNNLPGIGLQKAKKFICMTAETDMKKAIPKIPSYMNLKITIPDNYIDEFLKAEMTFKYMYVYDPIKRAMTRLNELMDDEDKQYCVNAGELMKPDVAYQIALGNINPKTLQKVSDYDPQKALPRSLKRPPIQNTKYKPLFRIWDYDGHHETASKVRQQSKITFVPVKFKNSSSEVSKIAEEENKVEGQIEMDSLISAYCGTEIATPSKPTMKRTSSVLNDDLNTLVPSSPNNPFAKRQSLESKEKADNVSLIKVLSSKDKTASSFEESRVVSRFFGHKSIQELEDPKEIIERIETTKIKREQEIQERLEANRRFYNTFKNVPKENQSDDEDDSTSTKSPLNQIKEKYGILSNLMSKSTSVNSINSEDEDYTHDAQPIDLELEIIEKDDDEISISSQNTASQSIKLKAPNSTSNKSTATKKMKVKSTSIDLSTQHKLSRFGFTTSNRNVIQEVSFFVDKHSRVSAVVKILVIGMFLIAELKSTVKVHPSQFNKSLADVSKYELNKKLANKILHNVGLCISFREIVSFHDSCILPADGSSHTDVIFRYIVFRPEIGSLLTGKIKNCTRDGVFVTLGFFDDIFIPKDELQHPSRFEETEQAWVWEYPIDEGQAKHDLFMDVGETVKFRVIDEEFVESEPTGPPEKNEASTSKQSTTANDTNFRPPYRIIGAINESGLGLESWWTQNDGNGTMDDEEEEEEDA